MDIFGILYNTYIYIINQCYASDWKSWLKKRVIKKPFFLSIKFNFSLVKRKNVRFFLGFFFKLLPNFSAFINADDCIGKITSKSILLYSFYIQKKIRT